MGTKRSENTKILKEKSEFVNRFINFHDGMLKTEDPGYFYLCIENTYENSTELIKFKLQLCKALLLKNKDLLKDGLVIDWNKEFHEGPLLASRVHLEILTFLIKQGANLEHTFAKETVVHNAAWYMNAEDFHNLCEFLITERKAEHLFRKNEEKWKYPLQHILLFGKDLWLETVEMLIQLPGVFQPEVDLGETSLLRSAICGRKSKDILEYLVNSGARYRTLLEFEILDHPLLEISIKGVWSKLKLLTDKESDITPSTNYLRNFLHLATWSLTQSEFERCVVQIHSHKSYLQVVNTKNIEGRTPLHERLHSLKGISKATVRFMIDNINDTNNKDVWGNNMFLSAVRANASRAILEILVEHGINFKDINFNGQNAMHLAALAGNLEAVKFLLLLNVERKLLDKHGATSLIYARHTLKQFQTDGKIIFRVREAGEIVKILQNDTLI